MEKITDVYFSLIESSGVSNTSLLQVSTLKTHKFSKNVEEVYFSKNCLAFLQDVFFSKFSKKTLIEFQKKTFGSHFAVIPVL